MNQFNVYKFIALKQNLEAITEHWSEKNRNLAMEILEEWCWTCPRQTLFAKWCGQKQQPQSRPINLTLL